MTACVLNKIYGNRYIYRFYSHMEIFLILKDLFFYVKNCESSTMYLIFNLILYYVCLNTFCVVLVS